MKLHAPAYGLIGVRINTASRTAKGEFYFHNLSRFHRLQHNYRLHYGFGQTLSLLSRTGGCGQLPFIYRNIRKNLSF